MRPLTYPVFAIPSAHSFKKAGERRNNMNFKIYILINFLIVNTFASRILPTLERMSYYGNEIPCYSEEIDLNGNPKKITYYEMDSDNDSTIIFTAFCISFFLNTSLSNFFLSKNGRMSILVVFVSIPSELINLCQ